MKKALTIVGVVIVVGSLVGGCARGPEGDPTINVGAETARLDSGDPVERIAAAYQLKEAGPRAEPAIPTLIGHLNDNVGVNIGGGVPQRLSAAVVDALVAIGRPAVKPLLAVLEYENFTVRLRAVEALAEIRDRRAVDPLLARLKDGQPSVVTFTVRALGDMGDRKAVKPLVEALGQAQDDMAMRVLTAEALTKLTGQDLGQDAAAWQDWLAWSARDYFTVIAILLMLIAMLFLAFGDHTLWRKVLVAICVVGASLVVYAFVFRRIDALIVLRANIALTLLGLVITTIAVITRWTVRRR